MIRQTLISFAIAAGSISISAQAQRAGVIDDPDGYVNVRVEKNAEAR